MGAIQAPATCVVWMGKSKATWFEAVWARAGGLTVEQGRCWGYQGRVRRRGAGQCWWPRVEAKGILAATARGTTSARGRARCRIRGDPLTQHGPAPAPSRQHTHAHRCDTEQGLAA